MGRLGVVLDAQPTRHLMLGGLVAASCLLPMAAAAACGSSGLVSFPSLEGLSHSSPLEPRESMWLIGELTREWSHQWPGCVDRAAWQGVLFGKDDLNAVRLKCGESSEAKALLTYAELRRRSLSYVVVAQPAQFGVVRSPDSESREAFLSELDQAPRTDAWLAQRYSFLRARIHFYANRSAGFVYWRHGGPSHIIDSLARSYYASRLAADGDPKRSLREFEWLEKEGSEFARGMQRQRCSTVEDVQFKSRSAPRSEWLFRCVVEAMVSGASPGATRWGRVLPSHRGLETLVRKLAARPATRKSFRLWFAAAWLAAGRGDTAQVERDLKGTILPGETEQERVFLVSLRREARFIAAASALPKSERFAELRELGVSLAIDRSGVQRPPGATLGRWPSGLCEAATSAYEVPGRFHRVKWRYQSSAVLEDIRKRRTRDPGFRWFFDDCVSGEHRPLPNENEELERALVLAILAEGRASELPRNTRWETRSVRAASNRILVSRACGAVLDGRGHLHGR